MSRISRIFLLLFTLFFCLASSFDYLKTQIVKFDPKVNVASAVRKKIYVKNDVVDLRRDSSFLGHGLDGLTPQGKFLNDQDVANILQKQTELALKRRGFVVDGEKDEIPDIISRLSVEKLKYSATNHSAKFDVVIEVLISGKISANGKVLRVKNYNIVFRNSFSRSPTKEKVGAIFDEKFAEILQDFVLEIEKNSKNFDKN